MNTDEIRTVDMPECNCPVCGWRFNVATGMRPAGRGPAPGDLSMCIYCTTILTFTESLVVREATLEEISKLPDDAKIILQRMRRRIQENKE